VTNFSSDLIICGFGGLSLVCSVAVAVLSFLNKKHFSAICTLYKEKFGTLPAGAIIFDKADSIRFSSVYAAKINFVVNPLIFGKSSVDSTNDDVAFIRGLPPHLKNWFIVEYAFSFLELLSIAINSYRWIGVVLSIRSPNQASITAGCLDTWLKESLSLPPTARHQRPSRIGYK
jgi:hypothetical protein